MSAFFRSIFLAALLCAGTAFAQSDHPDNPHSTKAKDKQGSGTPNSVTNGQTQSAETANPDSYNNKEDAAKPKGTTNVDAAETNNPHSKDFKDRDQMAGMDHGDMDHDAMMMKNATPQMVLQKLHMANQEEIKMGRLAEQNGTDKVKTYARTLEQDHTVADQKVMDLAGKKGWALNDTPKNPKMQQHQQAMQDRLNNLKGAEFDRTFTNMMAMGHKHLISMAQSWQQNIKDSDVKSLLNEMMPKLQQHAQMADQLKAPAAQGRAPETR
ncbi:MAG TPA: DUF4142 domain-containing protein [Myxococcales bacterium]|jgi:predicted outer membrane protein|nr:DUF4142 domain-containing protein [Myxococcales bacterium]